MSRNLEIRPQIDEGIDRKVLSQLRERFLKVNAGRLSRAMEALSTRQQLVLQLLPLLFHVNHPLLPGYVSGTTPAGLSGYEPDALILAELQRLTRSFVYRPYRGNQQLPIYGLFLMGSLGSLAQAEKSDMDFWLCHAPGLPPERLGELQRKCHLLEAWAATQGTEAHVFLIDPQRFVAGERDSDLTSDDCGTSQHYLLLDEFYRTALWLGGRTPIWWLVPTYEEARYQGFTHALLSKRFIRDSDVLDLGHLERIPPGEFIGAGMWQLFKGIDSPYKSVLKLLLTEVYASEHPSTECLALRFKRAVYANQLDLDELDPYMVVYRRLEEYLLQRGELERLELVRRCLYLKANKQLSRPPRNGRKSWQRRLLERLTSDWGWEPRQLAMLDSRSQWKVRQVGDERRALVNELTYSYRLLSQFARNQQVETSINRRDLGVLGRRLYAAFERKAGKVELVNPGIAPDLAEDTLTLVCIPGGNPSERQWALYAGTLGSQDWPNFAPIKRSRELIELLAWCHRNGVIDASTRISLDPGDTDLTEFELLNLLSSLQQLVPLPLPSVSEDAFLHPSVPRQILLLLNVGVDPLRSHSQMNVHMTSERTDSLGYSGVRENLVLTLDQVSLTSWNEMLVHRYAGPLALLDCLRDLFNQLPAGAPAPSLHVLCFCRNRAQAIASRVDQLLHDLLASFASEPPARYLLQIRQDTHILDLQPGKVGYESFSEPAQLLRHLGRPQPSYRPLRLDRHALEQTDLALILPLGRENCIQVFYHLLGDSAELTILDERNALWRQRQPYRDQNSLLNPLRRFLQSVLYRRDNALELDVAQPSAIPEVLYYELLPAATSLARTLEPRPAPTSDPTQPFHNVQAIIQRHEGQRPQVTLYCNQREFSELEYGSELFSAAARHILAQRRETERYPCYITDLDLSQVLGEGPLQTVHFLRYKSELEAALNNALQQV
jgi:adenylate cyclase class 1